MMSMLQRTHQKRILDSNISSGHCLAQGYVIYQSIMRRASVHNAACSHDRKRNSRFKWFRSRKKKHCSKKMAGKAEDSSSPTLTSDQRSCSGPEDQVPHHFERIMVDDVQIHIFSYLDIDSLRNVMSTNRQMRHCLFSRDANHLWLEQCRRQWLDSAQIFEEKRALVDDLKLPTAATEGRRQDYSTNLPLLISMKPDKGGLPPSFIDKRWIPDEIKTVQDDDNDSKSNNPLRVQFTGRVGTGNRSIRANHTLPGPGQLKLNGKRGLRKETWRPFVIPHMNNDGSVNLTPRLVSYYEVSIIKDTPSGEHNVDRAPTASSECVAVGLATASFDLQSLIPGWDCSSFGYHGDDGGLFHAGVSINPNFGPSFGCGDTVGCGMDHAKQTMFFTLNGKFLRNAWRGKHLMNYRNDLYPVVGIDTCCPVELNFGSKPFQFDLSKYIVQQAYAVAPLCALGPSRSPRAVGSTSGRKKSGGTTRR